jgi:putative CocE/NonD family hydrolase
LSAQDLSRGGCTNGRVWLSWRVSPSLANYVLKGLVVAAVVAGGLFPAGATDQTEARVSRLGEYRGYSSAAYDGWVRSSSYLTMRDSVRIAIDVFRPTKEGRTAEARLPVVWVLKRYQRATIVGRKVSDLLAQGGAPLSALLEHGYVLAAADSRGTGASFGVWEGPWTEAEAMDAAEITEWLASQPWSNGRVGMIGSSYEATTQLMAAARKPPHLRAIVPAMATFDLYDLAYPGGIFRYNLVKGWSELTREIDRQWVPAPVDADTDGRFAKEASLLRAKNRLAYDIVAPLRSRDDREPVSGQRIYRAWQPAGHVSEIRRSGVAVYLIGGWDDAYIRDAFLMFRNLGPRFKMALLDCSHAPGDPTILPEAIKVITFEQLRWFDYWLKGIDNGVTREPRISFQTRVRAAERLWRSTDRWPLSDAKLRSYYFQAGPSGSVHSANDGALTPQPPANGTGQDLYAVDFSATSGRTTRWFNVVGAEFDYPDMTANDRKGLTYTTEPLGEALDVTGHPILHLWLSSTAEDGDFIAFLEEVDTKGFSRYVSEGCLRASHRATGRPPYDNLSLPYHQSGWKDLTPLVPGEPAELVFDLLPVSTIFNAGDRLRVTVVCADRDNLETPATNPQPLVTVYRNSKAASRLDLPVVVHGQLQTGPAR